MSVAHSFLENPLVATSDCYHNHILISKKCYQLPMNFRRKINANVMIQNKSAFSFLPSPSDLFCVSLFLRNKIYVQLILIFKYIYICTDI